MLIQFARAFRGSSISLVKGKLSSPIRLPSQLTTLDFSVYSTTSLHATKMGTSADSQTEAAFEVEIAGDAAKELKVSPVKSLLRRAVIRKGKGESITAEAKPIISPVNMADYVKEVVASKPRSKVAKKISSDEPRSFSPPIAARAVAARVETDEIIREAEFDGEYDAAEENAVFEETVGKHITTAAFDSLDVSANTKKAISTVLRYQ
jgi:hypothetical protein